jgi:hypothetical protein
MNSSARFALLLGLQLTVGTTFLACGGEDSSDSSDDSTTGEKDGGTGTGNTSDDTLAFRHSPIYSAFVPNHEATVPVTLKDSSLRGMGVKFTSSDPSIATVTDTASGGLVTVKKEGTVTIKASLNGETGSTKLTITKFTEEQWMAGQARYSKTEQALTNPSGGSISPLLLQNPANRNANGACNTCHTAQAKTLKIENTPTQIAGYSDKELITIFTMGMKPEGVAQSSMVPSYAWGMFHEWEVTEEEKQGLIAFLRTQTPKDNPGMIDYGIKPCPDAGVGGPYCDNDGKPISFGNRDGGAPAVDAGGGATDAGAPDADVSDAGTADAN